MPIPYDDVVKSQMASIKKMAETFGTKAAALKKARNIETVARIGHLLHEGVSLDVAREAVATRREIETAGRAKAKTLGLTQK